MIGGHLFEEITSLENLLGAWQGFCRGKRSKREVQEFEFNLEDNLLELQTQLCEGSYRVASYESFYITDPKLRHIHKASVRDRVLFQAVYRVLAPIFEKQFIYDSFSSRIGKGVHAGVDRLEKFLIKVSENGTRPAWVLKCDIRKFFDSIDHETLFALVCHGIPANDEVARSLIRLIIDSHQYAPGKGLPLGNVTSQLFANIYLHKLDFFVKQSLRIKYYVRYCDDFVIVAQSPEKFAELIVRIKVFLQKQLCLTLHPQKIIIRKYSQGVDFLGYALRPHHRLLRTKTKRRLFQQVTTKNFPSYVGVLTHCNGHTIYSKIKQYGRHTK